MGQQQLLLVILVTIIVGIATVVAINIFGTASEQANRDAVRQDLLAAAANAQGIYARPAMMGGAGGDFGTLETPELLRRLNIPGALGTAADNTSQVVNENGTYTATGSGDLITITGNPSSNPNDPLVLEVENVSGAWEFRWNDGTGGSSDDSGGDGTS